MESREHAVTLVKYFERIARENENREVWVKGFNTAQEWLKLIDSENVSRADVSRFMGVVHANRYRTSGWYDLALGVYHWANAKGFELPSPEEYFASENLPSKYLFQEVSFQEQANLLVEYYQNYSTEDPESPVWSTGLKAAKEWQRLLKLSSLTEEDVSTLIELVENYQKYLSQAWFDLALGVYKWFHSRGFVQRIPSDFHSLIGL
jgi:hypothetical protein